MTLEIGKNIDDVRAKITGGDTTLANDIARDGLKAVFKGIGTFQGGVVTNVNPEWKKLMRNFAAENSKELRRLCGEDLKFNQSDWGLACIAYIACDSICTAPTTFAGGTKRSMSLHPDRGMIGNLDAEKEEDLAKFHSENRPFTNVFETATSSELSDQAEAV